MAKLGGQHCICGGRVDGSLLYKKWHLFVLFSLPNKNGVGSRRIIVFFFILGNRQKGCGGPCLGGFQRLCGVSRAVAFLRPR